MSKKVGRMAVTTGKLWRDFAQIKEYQDERDRSNHVNIVLYSLTYSWKKNYDQRINRRCTYYRPKNPTF